LRLDRRVLDRFGPVLGPTGLAVYLALARLAQSDGHCTVSLFEVAHRLGTSRKQILRAVAQLEALRLLRVERSLGYKNRYHLTPFSPAFSTFPQPVSPRNGEPFPEETPPGPLRDGEASPLPPRGMPVRDGSRPPTAPASAGAESETGENVPLPDAPLPPARREELINKNPGKGGAGENPPAAELLRRLTAQGVQEERARWLVAHHPPADILTQLRYLPYRRNMRDPAAALVRSIREGWAEPEGFRQQPQREREQAQYHQEAQQRAHNEATVQAQRQAWERQKAALPPDQLAALRRQAEATVRRKLRNVWPADKPAPQAFVTAELKNLVHQVAPPAPPAP